MQPMTKQEIYEHVGRMEQIAGMKRLVLKEGRQDGVNAVDVWNGSGMYMTILADRASDISSLTFQGKSICWLSGVGVSAPAFWHKGDYEWDRNFGGGMMATCGLTTAGLPCVDNGETLTLHGEISNIPSEEVNCSTWWEGDAYYLQYSAKTRQVRPYGENLCQTRQIQVKMGENIIRIRDVVENLGFQEVPLMVIYHLNFGYPLLDEGAKLYLTRDACFPTSPWAEESLDQIGVITPPDDGYKARAYNHTVTADSEGFAYASLLNEKIGLGATVKFAADNLNKFNLWKCLQKRNYVVGLEPCNCRTWGRNKAREHNDLVFLKPMERKEFYFEIQIHDGQQELDAAKRRYPACL